MRRYDVIVVGAGPAGSAAAYRLAKGGASVALLEKQILPRRKTCGGGMPMCVSDLLQLDEIRDLSPDAFLESSVRHMRHTYKWKDPVLASLNSETPGSEEISTEKPLTLWMVQRSVFDNALAQRAAKAGADLMDGLSVRTLAFEKGKPVRVTAEGVNGGWEAYADTIIGADGANGIVAKQAGLRRERTLAIAIEAEVPHEWGIGHSDLRKEICHLEYGAVHHGYAWIFPKGDHLNVGAGVFRPRNGDGRGDTNVRHELHKAILDYLKLMGIPKKIEDLVLHAHPLPVWNGMDTLQTRDNRVLLVGDSAGLINPFFGDGILHALKSGQIAAQSILQKDQMNYSKAIRAEFKTNFDAALKLAQFFYQFPEFCYQYGVRRPNATRTAARLLYGEALFSDISGRVLRRIRSEIAKSLSPLNTLTAESGGEKR